MQQHSSVAAGLPQHAKHWPALQDNRSSYNSINNKAAATETVLNMQQAWPFGMSPARPPGCILANPPEHGLHAFPLKTAALSRPPVRQHRKQEQPIILLEQSPQQECAISSSPNPELKGVLPVVPSELGRILLETSLRTEGWLSLRQGSCEVEFINSIKDRGLDSLQLTEDRLAEEQKASRNENGYKDIAEVTNMPLEHTTSRHKSGRFSGNRLVDSKYEQVEALPKVYPADEGSTLSRPLRSRCKEDSDWREHDIEGIFLALENAESLFLVVDILYFVNKCRESKNPLFSLRLYQHICMRGLETDVAVGNHVVPMFVECGDMLAASQTFNKLHYRNEHSWSFLVSGYALDGDLQHAVELYYEMDKVNIQPTIFTFLGLLKACALFKNVEVGRILHKQINQKGFVGDVLVGNCLVDMYIKCGSISEAEEVFKGLPVQDVVSWTALLAGYVECELGQEALTFYRRMQLEGISANAITLALAAKACRIIHAMDEGHLIHREAVEKGHERDLFVCNSMLSLYSKGGCLDEAHDVFDKLEVRDVVSWNTLIVAYIEHGHFQEAIASFVQMLADEVVPDFTSLSCVLKACACLGAVEQGQEVHIRSVNLGLAEDLSVANSLIGMYGRCGLLEEARSVFDKLLSRDVVSCTALIAGYAEHGHGEEALYYFTWMEESGLVPNAVTYSCTLKACQAIGAKAEGRALHMEVIKKGFDSELTIANTLVTMYTVFGSFVDAMDVFEKIPAKCVVSWTALIGGFADGGFSVEALKYFEQMQAVGVLPNSVTYACIVKACGSIGTVDKGRELHVHIVWDGFERDSSVTSALINMYARCGSLLEACEVFNDLSVRDISVWSSMMKAFAMNHEGSKALQCFKDMQLQGVKPDAVTFTCLLTACSHAGLAHEGLEYFKLMRQKYDVAPTREHYSCIVDLVARSGDLCEAEKFLETFASPSEDAWASLLSACKTHGEVDLGLRCFQQLVKKGPEDAAWYVLMTDIFTGAGRWEDAVKIEMLRKHAEAKKKSASAWIEVNNEVHEFVVGDCQDNKVLAAVRELNVRLKDEGHVPNLNVDVRPTSDEQKESALCEHAEKLAIAFGLLNTPQGTTLRVSKNLRMCADCHNASKIISKVERREIILRDDCCMHHFKDGACVCGDMF